jgi:hypothetical protein
MQKMRKNEEKKMKGELHALKKNAKNKVKN